MQVAPMVADDVADAWWGLYEVSKANDNVFHLRGFMEFQRQADTWNAQLQLEIAIGNARLGNVTPIPPGAPVGLEEALWALRLAKAKTDRAKWEATQKLDAGKEPPCVEDENGRRRKKYIDIPTTGRAQEEIDAATEYARLSNVWLDVNGGATIVSTEGDLRREANYAAARERRRADFAGTPYGNRQVGHVPDTQVTGKANPPMGWMPMPGTINQVIGSITQQYQGQHIHGYTVNGAIP